VNNGDGEQMTDQERQLDINHNLTMTCKCIMATIDVISERLDIVQKRLDRLEAFTKKVVMKRSVTDEQEH